MRKINEIILPCSATEAGKDYSVAEIREWHKRRGFIDIGYHYTRVFEDIEDILNVL